MIGTTIRNRDIDRRDVTAYLLGTDLDGRAIWLNHRVIVDALNTMQKKGQHRKRCYPLYCSIKHFINDTKCCAAQSLPSCSPRLKRFALPSRRNDGLVDQLQSSQNPS
jgi:hypothetical protein